MIKALMSSCVGHDFWQVCTLETSAGLLECYPLAQCGVLDVIKVPILAGTCLE